MPSSPDDTFHNAEKRLLRRDISRNKEVYKQQELRSTLCDARQATFLLCCVHFHMCQKSQVELVILVSLVSVKVGDVS